MHEAFLALTVLTLGAALLIWLLQRMGFAPVLGYLVLGVLVAPFRHSLFASHEAVEGLANVGIILLMFFIGLEFNLSEVRSMLPTFLGGGGLQVVLTAAGVGALATALGLDPFPACVIGVMLAMSSTALVMKTFEDRRESDSQRARVYLSVALMQDLAAILAVVAVPLALEFFRGKGDSQSSLSHAVQQVGLLAVVLPGIFIAARYTLPRVFQKTAAARSTEAFSLLSLGACLLVAMEAQWAGASPPLGAFLGGLVLSQTAFASQIMADLGTLRNLSLGLFFVSVGMLVDFPYITANFGVLMGGLLLLTIVKGLIATVALISVRTPLGIAAGVGLALAQVGEFSFVLGQQAVGSGVLSPAQFQYVLSLSVLSMLATPALAGYSGRFAQWAGPRLEKVLPFLRTVQPSIPPELSGESPSFEQVLAVVVGYGPVGRTLTRILRDFGIQPIVIDMNIETVKKLKGMGIEALYGDAGRKEILQAAKVEKASYLLVTLPDLPSRIPVVATARMLNPSLKILARARYLAERAMMDDAGASAVSYEESEVAVALSRFLLKEIGASDAEIDREAQRVRSEIALKTGFTTMMPGPIFPPTRQ